MTTSVTSYIQGHDASTLASHRSRSAEGNAHYLLDKITAYSTILDIGCGPGTITCDFAKYAEQGQIVGLDYSESVVEEAMNEAKRRGVTNVEFRVGDAQHLPFPDSSFDIVHVHAVLVHLPHPLTVMKEMRRVCKYGGYIAAREPDWSTCIIHPYNPALERWKELHIALKRLEGAEPDAGRHLVEWALAAGFQPNRVRLTADILMYAGKDEVSWWGKLYSERMKTEFGRRAVDSKLTTADEVQLVERAYLDWSEQPSGIWALTQMCLLCQK